MGRRAYWAAAAHLVKAKQPALVAGFFMRGRIGSMGTDYTELSLPIALWAVAIIVMFIYQSDRFKQNDATRPNLRAVFHTLLWSVPFTIGAFLIAVLCRLLISGL
jgi:hypothetical protein